jgi:uncharacterized protein with ParB-like and HNH nuclease domain|nr:MAG: Protein of unknown function DUF262 [Bacteriophage sp.]
MLSGNNIYVPNYQRAYSWDTESDAVKTTRHVNTFLIDLQDYVKSESSSRYYFGHFLFEEKNETCFGIIDGQQRLTTITIFLAALFNRLKEFRNLTEEEDFAYKSMIKVGQTYHFSTVDYDNQLFKDYVVNQIKTEHNGLDTKSKQRIVNAYDFFVKEFSQMGEQQIVSLLNAVMNASCTTHIVKNESEAIQMFIFQNNRGKKPSNLEIIKAQFLYNVHLYGGAEDEKNDLIDEIKNRFEGIYKSISKIEHKIDEDNVLTYTLRIFYNSLWENNAIQRVNSELEIDTRIDFIRDFTRKLASCFEQITAFFNSEREYIIYHSLILFGNNGLLFPFFIKALLYKISENNMLRLASSLESIFVRARIIGTRADLTSRLNDIFQKFDGDVEPIITRIDWMKKQDGWWGYWNDKEFERSLQGWIRHDLGKILLWKYENYLIQSEGKLGYSPIRYDAILNPHLEHIAPQTENPKNGYGEYDDEFKNQYIDCLGNYLLLSAYHNISIGNIPFEQKRETYTQLRQQQEVREMTEADRYWDKDKIKMRKDKILKFLLETF